jgi:hypothetical protein
MKKKKVEPKPVEGEVLFSTINDPEGLFAGDLCSMLSRRAYTHAEKRAVAGRPDSFEVVAPQVEDYYRGRLPDVLKEFDREVSRWTYPDVMPLGFDPAKTPDKVIRRIWRDDLTRALWTGLRWRRLVSQHFNEEVEQAADYFKALQRKGQFTRQAVSRFFWRMDCFGSAELTGVVAARLWPYLTGEKVFTYKVEEGK